MKMEVNSIIIHRNESNPFACCFIFIPMNLKAVWFFLLIFGAENINVFFPLVNIFRSTQWRSEK